MLSAALISLILLSAANRQTSYKRSDLDAPGGYSFYPSIREGGQVAGYSARLDETILAFFYSGAKIQHLGKQAGRLLLRPLIARTKPDLCELATHESFH
jgi:hypothetical protein